MKILVIDSNSIMNRAFYGIKLLSNSKGFFTNALTGFMNIYLKEIETLKPDCVAAAFDLKAPTFRHKAVASYKANRKGMPKELALQMPVIKELLSALGVKIMAIEGWEADDILGSVSKVFADNKNQCYILTGDRDNLQLINEFTTVRLATNRETVTFDRDKFFEEYGTEPKSLIDIKALMGDSSDNISGVAGIGEKTALSLIHDYSNIEYIYENLDSLPLSQGVKTKLANGKEKAFESKWLATISKEAPVEKNCEDYLLSKPDKAKAAEILTEMEMFKLLEKLGLSRADASDFEKSSEAPEKESSQLTKLSVSPLSNDIISNLTADTEAGFIYTDKLILSVYNNIYYTDSIDLTLDFYESDCKKIAFEAKSAYKLCFENGRELKNVVFCCDLAGYLLNSQSSGYTVENLCSAYHVPYRSDMGEYADAASLLPLSKKLGEEISSLGMDSLLYDIEQPLCEVLASMETIGVKIDIDGVKAFGSQLSADIKNIEEQIYAFAGKVFNISSPKQLGVVLFEDLGLPCKKKTKSGYSTNAEVLDSLSDKHPIIPLILEYRTLTKLNSTYVDGLLKVVAPDGRVHSSFNQTETRTGRISSTEPNVQNIPVRKEIGRNMRRFFISENGYELLDADYSQIELRVLASVCGDKNMQEAFLSGKDIHTATAAQVFGLPEEFVTPDMRRAAKAVNFGIVYGIGAFSLSQDIGVSVAEADRYIKQYLANYPDVDRFMKETVEFGLKNGYVSTIFNRRRYIPELMSSNKMLQAFGKRAAMNAPIQGAAADIIKIAMVKVYRRLKNEKLDAKLILQVHDELIVEASEKDSAKAAKVLSEEMQNAAKLAVPLTADVNTGKSWYDAKD